MFEAFVREHTWHKALFIGYSIRFEFTRVRSLKWFSVANVFLMNTGPFFFWRGCFNYF